MCQKAVGGICEHLMVGNVGQPQAEFSTPICHLLVQDFVEIQSAQQLFRQVQYLQFYW